LLLQCFSHKSSTQNLSYKHIQYGVEHGIPSSEVYEVLEDHDGFMWFGTDGGVARFDGYEFQNFTAKDGLSDNVVFHLYEDDSNRIWFMGFNGSLSYFQNDSIYQYRYNDQIKTAIGAKEWIIEIIVDSENNIEFRTRFNGYGKVTSDGNITFSNSNNSNYNELVLKDNPEGKDFIYMTLSGLMYNADKFLVKNEKQEKQFLMKVKRESGVGVLYEVDGHILFYFRNNIFYINKGKLLSRPYENSHLGIIGVNIDENDQFWIREINNGAKIYKNIKAFFDGKAPIHEIFKGLNISDVVTKDNGEMWISMENQGIYYVLNQYIEIYTVGGINPNNKIVSLFRNELDEMFYANEGGKVYKIDSVGRHTLFYDSNYDISKIYIDNDNTLYVSIFNGKNAAVVYDGIYHFNKRLIIQARNFVFLKNKDLFIVQGGRISKRSNGIEVYNSENSKNIFYVTSIFEDFDNGIWVGAREGLFEFKDDSLHSSSMQLGEYENTRINDVDQLSDSTLVIATAGDGLLLVNNFKQEKNWIVKNIGLKGPMLRDVHIDDSGEIWIASTNGLFRIKIKENDRFEIQRITHQNGLPANEINKVSSIGDVIYVATNKGLAIFNKNKLKINLNPPRVHVQSIKVNEKLIELDSVFDFNYNENNIEFTFVGLSYRSLGKVKYNYKLDGIDKKWQHTMSKKIRYPYLASKTYVFRLSATNEDGIWSSEKIITFTIHPPFWQTWWFITILSIIIITIVTLLIRQRQKRAAIKQASEREIELQKRKLIEAELKALRTQMNPHFTFNTLNSIQNSIINFDQDKALSYVSKFSLLLRKVLENSKYKFITVNEELQMLDLYVNLENLRFQNSIEYTVKIDPKIDQEFQEIPSMIIQPFIENSIIHGLSGLKGRKKQIVLNMSFQKNYILCVIEDNGIGREASEEINELKNFGHQSMGLEITKDRLELFFKDSNNELSFRIIDLFGENGDATGTRVEIHLFLQSDEV